MPSLSGLAASNFFFTTAKYSFSSSVPSIAGCARFGGKVVPEKQQKEWMSLISTKTGEPIETVSPDDLGGFALGLAKQILGPLGAQWFYEGSSLGYRTLYVWIADQDLMITVQTNSQPPEGTDKIGDAVSALYEIVKMPTAD